jgi:hypothetical protein
LIGIGTFSNMFFLLGMANPSMQVALGGISWESAPYIAKTLIGIHSCTNRSFNIARHLLENRLLLNFSAINTSITTTVTHCRMILKRSDVQTWQALPVAPRLRVFVNESYELVPIRNGTQFYSHFLLVFDQERHRFHVEPQQLVGIEESDNPNAATGVGLVIKFSLVFRSIGASEQFVVIRQSVKRAASLSLLPLLFFIPAVLLFFWKRSEAHSISVLNEAQTLPIYIENVVVLTCAGFTELLRLFVFVPLDQLHLICGLNLQFLCVIPGIGLRLWLHSILNDRLYHMDFIMFAFLSLFFVIFWPGLISVISPLLFGSFRGLGLFRSLVLFFSYSVSLYIFSRVFGVAFIVWGSEPGKSWFVRDRNKVISRPHFAAMIVYGIFGAVIFYPFVPYAFAFIDQNVDFDPLLLFSIFVGFSAYSAFFGLLRTVHRIHNLGPSWHDDHIRMQTVSVVLIVGMCFYENDFIGEIKSFDLLGLSFRLSIALTAGAAVFTFGTFGSYLLSLFFVVHTIVNERVPHETLSKADDIS